MEAGLGNGQRWPPGGAPTGFDHLDDWVKKLCCDLEASSRQHQCKQERIIAKFVARVPEVMKGVAPSAASASALKDVWHAEAREAALSDVSGMPKATAGLQTGPQGKSSSRIASFLDALPEEPRSGRAPSKGSTGSKENSSTSAPRAAVKESPSKARSPTSSEGKGDADEYVAPALPKVPALSRTQSSISSILMGEQQHEEDAALRLGKGHLNSAELDRTNTSKMLSDFTEATTSPIILAGLTMAASLMAWVDGIEEPERNGMLARIVFGGAFRNLCIGVIGLNAIFIWYTTDQEMYGMGRQEAIEQSTADLFRRMEIAFVIFYSWELTMKISLHRCYFFTNSEWKWNSFDLFLVVFSIGEQLIQSFIEGSSTANLSFLRMMRMLKIVKVLRLFRTLRYFNDLRLMMDCVVGSVVALFWCLVMIAFVLYIFGVLMMQLLMMYMKENDTEVPEEDREIIVAMFGSVGRACVTLFQSTTGGYDWNDVYEVLVPGGFFLTASFLFYILFFVVAAWNIVTSTFVEKALKLAQPDVEMLMLEQASMNTAHARELKQLFDETDTDGTGGMSYDEFQLLMEHPKFRSYLEVRGININDVDLFYQMLLSISSTDEVDLNTFVNACLRLKGFATSIDLHALKFETCVMRKKTAESIRKMFVCQAQIMDQLDDMAYGGFHPSRSPTRPPSIPPPSSASL